MLDNNITTRVRCYVTMRILHINSTIVVNSGVMSVLMNYYRHINRDIIQFDFLYFNVSRFNYETYEKEIKKLGGSVFLIENFMKIKDFNNKLALLLKKNHYKTVHIHDPFVVRFTYKTLRKCGVENIIVHSHATKWSDKRINAIRNRVLCINLIKKVDYCFACSHAAGSFLYGSNPFYVMNNAIDLERYSFNKIVRERIRNELGVDKNLVFGHVGNICAQKNHTFLIDVFGVILSKCELARLILIGDGVLRLELEKKIKAYGIEDKVMLLGKKSNVEDYYQAMDCIILPSLYEGLPMVGVEAQCAGLPILFSDAITGEVGADYSAYLSLNDTLDIWAEKAIELCKQDFDRTIGKQTMVKKGFDIEREAEKVQTKYIEIEEG